MVTRVDSKVHKRLHLVQIDSIYIKSKFGIILVPNQYSMVRLVQDGMNYPGLILQNLNKGFVV